MGDPTSGQRLEGLSWPVLYVSLILLYVLLHYLFVSQTAHMLALFAVFLGIATPEVPAMLMTLMLLFATNFFSVLTPQASSCNLLFVSSGYLTPGEVYRYGGILTAASLVIFLAVGTPWILLVT